MKHFLIIFLIVLCPFVSFATDDAVRIKSGSGDLVITITGFETNEGGARVAIVNSEVNYDEGNNYRQKIVPVEDKKAQYIVTDLEFGEYAIKIFHDENSNGELDTAMFGIPKEAYGFSNNARSKFGPPAYSEVVFKFESSGQEIFIQVN